MHPDRSGGSTTAFQQVAEAYALLSDKVLRRAYDMGDDLAATGRQDAPTLLDEVRMRCVLLLRTTFCLFRFDADFI